MPHRCRPCFEVLSLQTFLSSVVVSSLLTTFVAAQTPLVESNRLEAPGGASSDNFGRSVVAVGDKIVVGTPGAVVNGNVNTGVTYIYANEIQIALLKASDGAIHDNFGDSVEMAGDTIAVGASQDVHAPGASGGPQSGEGSVYVFERNEGGANAWG